MGNVINSSRLEQGCVGSFGALCGELLTCLLVLVILLWIHSYLLLDNSHFNVTETSWCTDFLSSWSLANFPS